MNKNQKKRNKAYYAQAAKKMKKNHGLGLGMKGFLITCNFQEKQTVRESYNLLNEYADKLYGSEKVDSDDTCMSEESDEDIEESLQKEVASMKALKRVERRFQVFESGANNCIFIKSNLNNPCELVHAIMTDIYTTKEHKARYILRLIPVSGTCRADEEGIKSLARELVERVFTDEGHTWCVQFKARNNNTVSRHVVIPIIGKIVSEKNEKNSVNFASPELVIVVEIIRTVCCICIVRDYYKFKKYNLHEIVDRKLVETNSGDRTDLKSVESSDVVQMSKTVEDPPPVDNSSDSSVKPETVSDGTYNESHSPLELQSEKGSATSDAVLPPDQV